MMKKVTVLMVTFLMVIQAFSTQKDSYESLFIQGNVHYSHERFLEAIADYEEALALGFTSGPLYYNLGNAYFKQGSTGKAIASYMRAKKLMPRDADLKANLTFAKSMIKDGKVQLKRGWINRFLLKLSDTFTLNEMMIIGVCLYFIMMIFLIIFVLIRNKRRPLTFFIVPTFVALIVFMSMCWLRYDRDVIQHEAVTIGKKVKCRFEPFNDATTHFVLHEGENVLVTSFKGEWIKIKRLDGLLGWVKKKDIELL